MPIPGVSLTAGPEWASDLNASLTILDGHNHSSGSGVQINPGGININSDLPFNINNATLLRSVRFSAQLSPLALAADLGCLYESGVDLWYNDANGNQIQITQGGGVAGSPGSIANLTSPASASYVSADGVFVWQQAADTSADMDFGSAIMRNDTANSKGLTLSPPAAMGADYSLVLPSLPASQKFMTLDASGNMSAPWAVDNSTVEIASSTTLRVKASGISTTQLADGAVTRPKLGALGQQVSLSSGSFSTSSQTPTLVTNLSVTITTTGRPVFVGLIDDGTGGNLAGTESGSAIQGIVRIRRGSTVIATCPLTAVGCTILAIPVSSVSQIDINGAAGTYTYTVQAFSSNAAPTTVFVQRAQLVAYEL